MDNDKKLTLGSLFDGSGGFPLAGLMSGIEPKWASEIEPFPIRVTTKRLPYMKHYGDIHNINGGALEPVDIITFGSPCQDLSVAGRRDGLEGNRSNLFFEAVRVIKEMRDATDGRYPRYAVWENVTGAFSSNKGEDFRTVLEEICSVKCETDVPRPKKWFNAGEILADNYSVAWRVLDAQYWGVPQRRKRIFLIADFGGQTASKVLFESEGVSGYSKESFRSRQRTAASAEGGSGAPGICLNDQGGERMDVTNEVTCTLRAKSNHPPVVMAAGFNTEPSAKSRSGRIGYAEEKSPTIRAGVVPAVTLNERQYAATVSVEKANTLTGTDYKGTQCVFENHSQDTRYKGPLDAAPTVSSTYGEGGNNQPLVVSNECYDIRFTSEGSKEARANVYETDTARTVDTGQPSPDRNQGGVAVVERYTVAGGASVQYREVDTSPTLDTTGAKPTCNQAGVTVVESRPLYALNRAACCAGQNAKFGMSVSDDEKAQTLTARGPGAVAEGPEYSVRRLTPTECGRLQGFPDYWAQNLETENPTDEDLEFWRKVFDEYSRINGIKQKSDNQIIKWLKKPGGDSALYKMWGNGVALPCVYFVLSGIAYYAKTT